MSTAVNEDVSTIEHLDFAPECDLVDECGGEAHWIVHWRVDLVKCPHPDRDRTRSLLCDSHHAELIRELCDNVVVWCPVHETRLGRARDIIRRIEPL